MFRILTSIAVMLSLAGVATGNLFRPCDCASDAASGTCEECHFSPSASESRSGCCGGCDERGGSDGGCTICCKPRPAFDEANAAVDLDAPGANGSATVGDEPDIVSPLPRKVLALAAFDRPAFYSWLFTQEGLSVFRI